MLGDRGSGKLGKGIIEKFDDFNTANCKNNSRQTFNASFEEWNCYVHTCTVEYRNAFVSKCTTSTEIVTYDQQVVINVRYLKTKYFKTGQKFAMMEMKMAVAEVLREFVLEPVTHPDDIRIITDVVLRNDGPVEVTFVKRP